jgi:sugar lactone lactonase YvrE
MNFKANLFFAVLLFYSCSHQKQKEKVLVDKKTIGLLPTEKQPNLEEVATFKGIQISGIAISQDNRLFASIPRWRKDIPFSVVEMMSNGDQRPYPDVKWNSWEGKPHLNTFTSIQSLYAEGHYLYVLDSSSPEMKVTIDLPKLYRFDLRTNQLDQKWEFDQLVAPKNAYLDNFIIDHQSGKVFITDSGLGGIIVLDMETGKTKRLLTKHPSTKAENVVLTIDKKEFKKQIHSDGIALSPVDHKIYYHALSGYRLYRVPVEELEVDLKDETNLVKKIEKLGVTPSPDGMIFDQKGNLFMGDLERNAVSYRTPSGQMKILIEDERIKWPDSLAIDRDNNLIFTDSNFQATEMGKSVEGMIFKIYKVSLPIKEL